MTDRAIDGAAIALFNYTEQLLKGKEKDIPEEAGQWTEYAQAFRDAFLQGKDLKGVEGAIAMVETVVASFRKSDTNFNEMFELLSNKNVASAISFDISKVNYLTAPPLVAFEYVDQDTGEVQHINAYIDPSVGAGSRGFLDRYIANSKIWAARGYELFHEGAALFLLSAVAARRIYLPVINGRFTGLYICFGADTTIYTKSVVQDVAIETLKRTGLFGLIRPKLKNMTSQYYYKQASRAVPEHYASTSGKRREEEDFMLSFAGQRSLLFDEFGDMLSGLAHPNSPRSAFHDMFLEHWSPGEYDDGNMTISRGADRIEKPYLSILANLTPANFRDLPRGTRNLWTNGFMPRWVILCPPEKGFKLARMRKEAIQIPDHIIRDLRTFHDMLGKPKLTVEEEVNPQGRGTGVYNASVENFPCNNTQITDKAWEAFENYSNTMVFFVGNGYIPKDLNGCYGRFAEQALRVAALLAWMHNGGVLDYEQWAAAQTIVEKWRSSLHEFYNQVSDSGVATFEHGLEDRVLKCIAANKVMTANEVRQRTNLDIRQLTDLLCRLVEAGLIVSYDVLTGNGRITKIYCDQRATVPDKYTIIESDKPAVKEEVLEEERTRV